MAHRRSPGADSDLDDIWDYATEASGSIELADRLIDSLSDRFYLLSGNPRIGRPRDDLRPGLRAFAVGQFIIIYRIEEDDVIILRVFNSRQHPCFRAPTGSEIDRVLAIRTRTRFSWDL